MLFPEPTAAPPHELVYHFQLALLPRLPPLTLSVTLLPLHMESIVAVMEAGAVDRLLTLMVLFTQIVVLQVPSALTK